MNIDKYLNRPAKNLNFTVECDGEKFEMRRMTGEERLACADFTSNYDTQVYVLSRCVFTGDNNEALGEERAKMLIDRYDALASFLANKVAEYTLRSFNADMNLWKSAEKNFATATNSKSCEESIGSVTV